jgi:hypothetical protein
MKSVIFDKSAVDKVADNFIKDYEIEDRRRFWVATITMIPLARGTI